MAFIEPMHRNKPNITYLLTLTIEHMLLECTVLQQIRDEYYMADSLRTLFETILPRLA